MTPNRSWTSHIQAYCSLDESRHVSSTYSPANNIILSNGLLPLGNKTPIAPMSPILAPLSTLPAAQSALLLR